jgi:hypothetical protein
VILHVGFGAGHSWSKKYAQGEGVEPYGAEQMNEVVALETTLRFCFKSAGGHPQNGQLWSTRGHPREGNYTQILLG